MSINLSPALSLPRKGTETDSWGIGAKDGNQSRTLLTPQGDGNCGDANK